MNILGISPNVMYKEFIKNPKVQQEIEISESLSELSTEKLELILEIAKKLKDL